MGVHPTRCAPENVVEEQRDYFAKNFMSSITWRRYTQCMKKQRNVFALVIDDDHDQAELIKEVIAPEGYYVLTTDNAEEGLRLSERYHPFVIIADFGMPDMDGAEMVERLRANGTSDIPVVLVTAYPPEYVEQKLDYDHLPDLIISKPVDFDLLLEIVRDYYQNGYQPEQYLQNQPHDCFVSASLL